ncbi:MAG: type II secretion system protein [Rhabdochlamydiaceae bacterium]
MRKRQKQFITLIEIMVVIFIIGLIGGVLGYNMKESMEQGKAFKSEHGAAKLKELLSLEVAHGADIETVTNDPLFYLKQSNLSRDPEKLLKDGWGERFDITHEGGDVIVKSSKYDQYLANKQARSQQNAPSAAQAKANG